ncbi:MAG: hypothetical protein KFF73_19020 [Cyclobacteriaceae bacterium]|nr:hypothetical protein [Cyclobacteriaceae bacterium]
MIGCVEIPFSIIPGTIEHIYRVSPQMIIKLISKAHAVRITATHFSTFSPGRSPRNSTYGNKYTVCGALVAIAYQTPKLLVSFSGTGMIINDRIIPIQNSFK